MNLSTNRFSTSAGTFPGARGYDYDDADQLVRITATNQWKSEFVYDAFGRRIVRKEFAWQSSIWSQVDEVRYVWQGMSVLQERDAANNVKVTYTGRLAREDSTSTSFYFTDGNGNVSSLIDSSGSAKARYRYDSFGNLLSKSGPLADANLIRFSGKEYHANSGLYYYGFRFYAPNLQRWLNEDPIGIAGGLNLYSFVGNDPINFFDPFGLVDMVSAACREKFKDLEQGWNKDKGWNKAVVDEILKDAAAQLGDKSVNIGEALDDPLFAQAVDYSHGGGGLMDTVKTLQWVEDRRVAEDVNHAGENSDIDAQDVQLISNSNRRMGDGWFGRSGFAGQAAVTLAFGGLGVSGLSKPARPQVEAAKPACPSKEELKRLYPRNSPWRAGVKDEVFDAAAAKSKDGRVYDPYTGKEIKRNEPWELGHEPNSKFSDWQRRAYAENWSREDWNDFLNDPARYRPETRFTNEGHYRDDPYP